VSTATDIIDLLDDDPSLLTDAARRTLTITNRGDAYTEEELDQLVHAFGGALRERLAGTGTEVLDFMLQTAIPAIVARGERVSELARSSAVFGVLLSVAITERLEPDARGAAVTELASFFGEWERDIVEAAQGAA